VGRILITGAKLWTTGKNSTTKEAHILDLSAQGLSREFANPDRVGCPGSDVLRGIAFRKLRLADVRQRLAHLSSCSPCYMSIRRDEATNLQKPVWLAPKPFAKRLYLIVSKSSLVHLAMATVLLGHHGSSCMPSRENCPKVAFRSSLFCGAPSSDEWIRPAWVGNRTS